MESKQGKYLKPVHNKTPLKCQNFTKYNSSGFYCIYRYIKLRFSDYLYEINNNVPERVTDICVDSISSIDILSATFLEKCVNETS